MEIDELKLKARDAENAIIEIVNRFANECSVKVNSIEVNSVKFDYGDYAVSSVRLIFSL